MAQETDKQLLIKNLKKIVSKVKNDFKSSHQITDTVQKAVFDADFSAFKDFSDDFFKVYKIASEYNTQIRNTIQHYIQNADYLSDFDKILIYYAAEISKHYDKYYEKWAYAVRKSKAAQKIIKLQKENPSKLQKLIKEANLDHQYTINVLEGTQLKTVPYAVYFKEELRPILKTFDRMIGNLKQVANKDFQKDYVKYLEQYQKALSNTDIKTLEQDWIDLDIAWLKVKYYIQIVHDIEYDYGDPLRIKVIPDFSIRFLDPTYEKSNKEIEEVQQYVVKLYKDRNHSLKENGIKSVLNCLAGIYYLPFNAGMSLHFKFSGQSIPNRPEIKERFGVKIYFDPDATAKREEQVRILGKKVLKDRKFLNVLNPLDTIVYHVSAHEFGHAIYPLKAVKNLDPNIRSQLEETRAERVALNTMYLMFKDSKDKLTKLLISFALSDLRRFASFNSTTTWPYTISAMDTYNIYEKTGFMYIEGDKLIIDESKVIDVMNEFKKELDLITQAEETEDNRSLHQFLEKASKPGKLAKWLVQKLNK